MMNKMQVAYQRIDGVINILSSAEKFSDAAWILSRDAIASLALAVVDRVQKDNYEFQGKAGLEPNVVRTTTNPNACDWCKAMAGKYVYPHEPKDIWKRHTNCTCLITYTPVKLPYTRQILGGQGKRWEIQSEYDIDERKKIGIVLDKDKRVAIKKRKEFAAAFEEMEREKKRQRAQYYKELLDEWKRAETEAKAKRKSALK